jgi:hypothetical protein
MSIAAAAAAAVRAASLDRQHETETAARAAVFVLGTAVLAKPCRPVQDGGAAIRE